MTYNLLPDGLCPLSSILDKEILVSHSLLLQDMIAIKETLKDLLHPRHNHSYLDYWKLEKLLNFPFAICFNNPSYYYYYPFLACLFKAIRSPKWSVRNLRFQFDVMSVVDSGRSAPLFTTKSSRPKEIKVMGIESKNFPRRLLGVIMSGTPLSYPLIP